MTAVNWRVGGSLTFSPCVLCQDNLAFVDSDELQEQVKYLEVRSDGPERSWRCKHGCDTLWR